MVGKKENRNARTSDYTISVLMYRLRFNPLFVVPPAGSDRCFNAAKWWTSSLNYCRRCYSNTLPSYFTSILEPTGEQKSLSYSRLSSGLLAGNITKKKFSNFRTMMSRCWSTMIRIRHQIRCLPMRFLHLRIYAGAIRRLVLELLAPPSSFPCRLFSFGIAPSNTYPLSNFDIILWTAFHHG